MAETPDTESYMKTVLHKLLIYNVHIKRAYSIVTALIPVVILILLIPYTRDDFVLTGVYCIITGTPFSYKKLRRDDYIVFCLGFFSMIFFEFIFIKTGVETFTRKSLLGIMPLWLPFLWAYGFIVIKHVVALISNDKANL